MTELKDVVLCGVAFVFLFSILRTALFITKFVTGFDGGAVILVFLDFIGFGRMIIGICVIILIAATVGFFAGNL